MKILATLLLAFALASPALEESRAQSEASFTTNNRDNWAVSASVNIDNNQLAGDTPESTRVLNYVAAFKDFSDLDTGYVFFPSLLGFLHGGEVNNISNNNSRILTSESEISSNIDSTEIFSFLFRSFSVRNGNLDNNGVEVTYVRGSNSLDTNVSLLSRDEPDLMLGFFYRAIKMGSNYDDSDVKLKDSRYTLD